jgi:hypothetical protein
MITKNIEILPMIVEDTETIARIHTQSWQESYKGILEQEYLDSLTYVSRLEFRKKIITNQAQEELHIGLCVGFSGTPLLDRFRSKNSCPAAWCILKISFPS